MPPLEPNDQRHLQAAQGYIALGMVSEANDELEQINAACRRLPEVLAVSIAVYQKAERWEMVQVVAKQLATDQPDNPQWPISLAYATRRLEWIDAAKTILLDAATKHRDEPIIHYNLGCYECQLGNIDVAKDHLMRAFQLQPKCTEMALDDPDLAPLWRMIATLE